MKRLVTGIGLFFCSCFGIQGQNNPYNEVSIASPTAAALGKYADVPVSAHTGIPQISIPIYTLKEGSLSVPISLNYHAGGLKVWETSSWVGAGWSLNAGGVITRTVMGAPDERGTSNVTSQTHGYLSDSGYSTYLFVPNSQPFPYQPPAGDRGNFRNDFKAFAEGKKDGEPDIFFFNVGGYSGKFFFRDDGKPIIFPEQDIRIVYDYTPGTGSSISSFALTTPDGTQYFFGKTGNSIVEPIERTNPMNDQSGLGQGQVISSWYLNKIQSADGIFSIEFRYVAESYSYYTISSFPVNYYTSNIEYSLVKNMVTGVRLDKIISSNATIEFQGLNIRQDLNGTNTSFVDDANSQAMQLDVIKVYDSTSSNGKKFLFTYDYFYDGSNSMPGWYSSWNFNVDRKRLKLISIQEQSLDGTVAIPPHQFEYFTEYVPRRLFFGIDHWGFNNGVTTNTGLIPTYFMADGDKVVGANRDASWPEMRAGAIKKITYPTKGSAEYVFENNATWVNFMRKEWIYQLSFSSSYSGVDTWNEQDYYFDGSNYRFNFSNPNNGSQAQFEVYKYENGSTVQLDSWVLEPNTSAPLSRNYSAGTYKIRIRKLGSTNGTAAVSQFLKQTDNLISKNEIVGGLRINSTILRDGISETNNVVSNYEYLSNGKSTGFLYARPNYLYKLRNDVLNITAFPNGELCSNSIQGMGGCRICGSVVDLKSGSSVRVLGSSQGNHIGYNEVKISQTGNGYKILRFFGSDRWDTDFSDVAFRTVPSSSDCNLSTPNYPNAPLPYEYQRGELKYEGVFGSDNKLLLDKYYVVNFSEDPISTPAIVFQSIPVGDNTVDVTLYNIKSKKKISIEETVTTYSQSAGQVQQVNGTYYESQFHHSPTRITSTTSQSGALTKKIKYSFDYRAGTCDQIANLEADYSTDVSAALQTFNITWTPIPFFPDSDPNTTDYNYRYWSWQYYMYDMSLARIKYVRARRQYFTGVSSTYNTCLTGVKSTADSKLKPIIELQQRNINVPIETTEWRDTKLISATYNNYVYATSPSGFVYPGSVDAINISSQTAAFSPSSVSGTTIVKDAGYKLESSAVFANGNILEITPKNGVKVSYLWGYKNTLPIAKAVGEGYANLSSAYVASGFNLSQLRNQGGVSNALVSTYSHHPFIGILTESDPNGKMLSYSYDKLQRLSQVKDQNNYILKQLCYGYAGQPVDCNMFYNNAVSGTFMRNNCGIGYSGSSVVYTVPAGTYASSVSQVAANTLAQNDVITNGQAYANTHGTCVGSAITVQGYNGKSVPYKVKFTNNATNDFYVFDLFEDNWDFVNLGQIPIGTYTVTFYKGGGVPANATFVVNGFTTTTQALTFIFYNISVTSTVSAYMY